MPIHALLISSEGMRGAFDPSALNDDPSTIYALDPELRITYMNLAWARFALANGAHWADGRWGLGTRIIDAVPTILRPFYEHLFEAARTTSVAVEHDYECSSGAVFRRFRMRVMPCERDILLVVHSLLRESPRACSTDPAPDFLYRNQDGLIVQCSHCRCVRRARTTAWELVPAYVERAAPGLVHGLCTVCRAYYYPSASNAGPSRS